PSVLTHPANQSITYGQSASFTSTASGDPTPTVQWQVDTGGGFSNITDGGVYGGATTTTLNLTQPPVSYSGNQYRAVFTNALGTATSNIATLTVTTRALEITADSDSKVYDGTALTDSGYSITDGTLAAGHTLDSVTVTGSQTAVGSSDNVPSAAVILDGAVDVTANYDITYVNGTLTISPVPTTPITVTYPDGGDSWVIGSIQTITWTSTGVTGPVRIQLSRNGGSSWMTIIPATPNDGSQAWLVTGPATNQARIRVVSILNPAISDISNNDFAITVMPPSITVISPNGGETWATRTMHRITWTSTGIDRRARVRIELSRDGGSSWTTIIHSTPNDGSAGWMVSGSPTTQALIRITTISTPAYSDTSDDVFAIRRGWFSWWFPWWW
ncbi:MAG TPA: hypothetical protein VIH69_07385, partial [Dehalococcoidia bacterium]